MSLTRKAILGAAAALATGGLVFTSAASAPAAEVEEPPVGTTATSEDVEASKVYKNVWTNAPSYYSSFLPVATGGTLFAGSNYFYCQTEGRSYSDNGYSNDWWLKTDDDSGNSNVWVNAVYISGGDDYEPISGVPRC